LPGLDAGAGEGPGAEEVLEEALSLAATVCWEWCRQKGDEMVLAVAGPRPQILAGTTSLEHACRLLGCLAQQEGGEAPDLNGLAAELTATRLPPAPVLLVSTRGDGFADRLAARLRRPVSVIDVSASPDLDFYERPADAL
jgi:uncharacterized protein (DUF58 family)